MYEVNSNPVRAAADVVDALEESARDLTVSAVSVEPDRVTPERHEVLVETEFTVDAVDDLRDDRVAVTSDHAHVTDAVLEGPPDVNYIADGPVDGYADYRAVITTENEQQT